MQDIKTYLNQTETAVQQMFNSLEYYQKLLAKLKMPMYISDSYETGLSEEYFLWEKQNKEEIERQLQLQQDYIAEIFSEATLSGAILQVAEKAIEVYSSNNEIPYEWRQVVNKNKAKFCVGRAIRGVPIGLIIHASRNQHMHYEDEALHSPGKEIFATLADCGNYKDPAFDLDNPVLASAASNILALLGWSSYEDYTFDVLSVIDS